MTPRRALLAALLFTAAVAVVLMADAVPSGADYSDPGPIATSTVPAVLIPPANVERPAERTARTGIDADDLTRVAVLLVAGGAAISLTTRKRRQRGAGS